MNREENRDLKRTVFTLSAVATIALSSFSPWPGISHASASKLTELQQQKEQIDQKKSGVDSKIHESNKEIANIQNEKQALEAEMKRIDLAIGDTNTKIVEKSQQIGAKKAEIDQLQNEIQVITERINKRNELLKDRARSFQENGGRISYLEVLMGAQTFGDFIDRIEAVATILEADQDILRQHRQDKQLLEEKQKQVEADLAQLERMRQELKAINEQLNAQKAEKDRIMADLQQKEETIHAEKLELEEQAQLLAAQGAAIQKAMELEKQRLAAIAEQQRQAAARTASSSASGTSAGGGSGSAPTVSQTISNGIWTKPAVGTLTSGLGQRWGEFHAGIDIANSQSVPIWAAADGVVIRSYYSSSYGNVIFMSHYFNGQVYTTVYAHMSSRLVGEGAVVKKGQTIGYMGNTGYSTGQHLHFELHVGEWNAAKSNAVNPLNYFSL
jgi:peptidoglycan hydrolase CwlO-like protein